MEDGLLWHTNALKLLSKDASTRLAHMEAPPHQGSGPLLRDTHASALGSGEPLANSIHRNSECAHHSCYAACTHTTLARQLGSAVMCHRVSWCQALRGFFLALQSPAFEIGAELTPKTNKETPMTLWNVGGPHSPKNVVSHQGFLTVLPNRMLTMAALNTSLQKQLS